eukprot:TRINITY_DN9885_c0_g1_i2.p1 TRINITY_DN9885_c0_g1~~TRINITY_DN9885_c0_g1_i2.p1  ORF type:complete len:516 (+),score=176.22 TRINITY_DN9885_c0_g1_i2:75-1550(+)
MPLLLRTLSQAIVCQLAAAAIDWDHDPDLHSLKGPHTWATRSVHSGSCGTASCAVEYPYADCAGQQQSPVDITSDLVDTTAVRRGVVLKAWSPLRSTTPAAAATSTTTGTTGAAATAAVQSERVLNDGHGIRIAVDYAEHYLVSPLFPHNLRLREIVYRTPAEHLIDGVRHPVERQMVFTPADVTPGSTEPWAEHVEHVRISTLYAEAGQAAGRTADGQQLPPLRNTPEEEAAFSSDPVLNSLHGHLTQLRMSGDQLYLFEFTPPTEYLDDELYAYQGSATEPPCAESTTWLVSSHVRTVTSQQVQRLRLTMPHAWGNARPVQPLGARAIRKIRPNVDSAELKVTFGELARAQQRRRNLQEASRVRSDGQAANAATFDVQILDEQSAQTHSAQRTERILKEVTIALSVTLALLLCGLFLLLLVRQGVIAPYMLPQWLGGVEEPVREQWSNSVTKQAVFGTASASQRDEEDGEEMDEDESDEEDGEERSSDR